MDGKGPSKISLDGSKGQILVFDYEWLSIGRVRVGFMFRGKIVYCHEFDHANIVTSAYMSTPNLPMRYEIENDGSGVASSLECICGDIVSEGGQSHNGIEYYESTEGTHIDCATANVLYPIIGMRLKSTHLDSSVEVAKLSMLNETADNFEWVFCHNPTLSGAATFNPISGTAVEIAINTGGSLTVTTPNHKMKGGFIKSSGSSGSIARELEDMLHLGADIANVQDEQWLCCRPLSANADIEAGITWRELS